MFSSLPSASKIYVSSSTPKPRPKCAAASSARRRKKKSLASDGETTLVSLVDPARIEHTLDILDRTFNVSGDVLTEDSEFFGETSPERKLSSEDSDLMSLTRGTEDVLDETECSKESNHVDPKQSDSVPLADNEDCVPLVDNEDCVPLVDNEDCVPLADNKDCVSHVSRSQSPVRLSEELPSVVEAELWPEMSRDKHISSFALTEDATEESHTHSPSLERNSEVEEADCVKTVGLQVCPRIVALAEEESEDNAGSEKQTLEEEDPAPMGVLSEKDHSTGECEKVSSVDEKSLDSTQQKECLYEPERTLSPEELSCTESVSWELQESSCKTAASCKGFLSRSSSFPPQTRNPNMVRVRCVDKGTSPCCKEAVSKAVSAQLGTAALTTAQARARSYVYGSTGHTGSLLGNEELNRLFPDNEVTIFVGTWNMNGHSPPPSLDDFLLPADVDALPDIYAVGVQEGMQSRFEWEVLVQGTLGPSHALLCSSSLGVLHLSLFLRRDLLWFCSEPEEASVATRPGTLLKTKGAVAVAFHLFGTSFLFVNAHLAAHEQKLKERLSDYEKIVSSLDLPKAAAKAQDRDVTSRFDVVLWCGDLNFRVVRERSAVLSFVEQRHPSRSFLLERDQLCQAMRDGSAFKGFLEGVIHFDPSYKFAVGTDRFATAAPLRTPSYTDRILYRVKEGRSRVLCLLYDAASHVSTSDHKPVFGLYRATLRPGRDSVPLAAGLFKRDVYLEALRRRSQFVGAHSQSTVCSLM